MTLCALADTDKQRYTYSFLMTALARHDRLAACFLLLCPLLHRLGVKQFLIRAFMSLSDLVGCEIIKEELPGGAAHLVSQMAIRDQAFERCSHGCRVASGNTQTLNPMDYDLDLLFRCGAAERMRHPND